MPSVAVCLVLLLIQSPSVPPDSVAILEAHRLSSEFDHSGAERVLSDRIATYGAAPEPSYELSLLYFELGKVYHDNGNLLRAHQAFQRSFDIDTALKDEVGLAVLHQRIGLVLMDMGHYRRAFDHFLTSTTLADEQQDSLLISYNAHNIGVIYEHLENFERAAEFYQRSITLDSLRNDRHGYAIGLMNRANIRSIRGDTTRAMADYRLVTELAEELNDSVLLSEAIANQAHMHSVAGREDIALRLYRQALTLSRQNQDDLNTAFFLTQVVAIHLDRNDYAAARVAATEAIAISRKTQARPTLMTALDQLAKAEAGSGRHDAAYRYLSESSALRDSIYSAIDIQEFVQAEMMHAFERQKALETQLADIEQRRVRAWIWAIGLTLVALALGLAAAIVQYRKNRGLYHSLKRAEQSRSALFSIMAHDIKNPLTGIIGLSGIIVDDARDMSREEIWSFAHRMNKSAQNLNRLLDNLLDWSRVELDQKRFALSDIHPYETVHRVWNLLEEIARTKNVTLRNRIQPDVMFQWDPYILDSILRNLISNAIKYSYRDGLVIVGYLQDGPEHIITVRDFGPGMKVDTLRRIMQDDEVISTPGTESELGSGLGLLISKQVAEKNNARITFGGPLDMGVEVQLRIIACSEIETPSA